MRHVAISITLLLAASACKHREEPAAAAAIQAPIPASAPGATRPMEPSTELGPIVQRLQWEAENRPEQALTADQVFDALDTAGVSVGERRQYLGVRLNASYCAGGSTPDGLAISICEYPSPRAAQAGKVLMDRQFAAMTPHARRILRGQTLLTIAAPSPAQSPAVTRAVQTFTRM